MRQAVASLRALRRGYDTLYLLRKGREETSETLRRQGESRSGDKDLGRPEAIDGVLLGCSRGDNVSAGAKRKWSSGH